MQRDDPDGNDAAWNAIVANYGDLVLDPVAGDVSEKPAEPRSPAGSTESMDDTGDTSDEEDLDDLGDGDDLDDLDDLDQFVPEDAPRVPMPPPDRFLAWLGVFGSPVVLLVWLVLGLSMPSLLSWILIGGFIGGFCYLVFTLPRAPRDPWDDGARV